MLDSGEKTGHPVLIESGRMLIEIDWLFAGI